MRGEIGNCHEITGRLSVPPYHVSTSNGAANYCDGVIVGIAYLHRGDVFRFLAARAPPPFWRLFQKVRPRCRIARVQCTTMDSWTNLVRSPAEQMVASQSFYWQRGWVEVNINRRDQELLDRRMRRFQPSRRPVGVIMLILAGAFLVGMIAGSIVFTRTAADADDFDRWQDGSSFPP